MNKKCLHPECNSLGHARGLCYSHYNTAMGLVRNKAVTMDWLVEHGKILPKKTRRPSTEWFLKEKKDE